MTNKVTDYIPFCEEHMEELTMMRQSINQFYPYDIKDGNQIRNGMNIAHYVERLLIEYEYLIEVLGMAKKYETNV